MGMPNPSRQTEFSGANGDREKNMFPVQLTTSRIGNLTRLILLLLYGIAIIRFPCPRSRLRIWSLETASAVSSRVSLLISILGLNLELVA